MRRTDRSGGRAIGRVAGLVVAGLVAALIVAPAAWAQSPTPFVDIQSAGPLSNIYIGNDLGCQVRGGGFSSTEFFPNAAGAGDCGTLLFLNGDNVDSQLFGPDFANHPGGTETSFSRARSPFTASAGNQTLTGSGTAASPYEVTTTVTLTSPTGNIPGHARGDRGRQLRRRRRLLRHGPDDHERRHRCSDDNGAELYHAADCQLRGSDTGFGAFEPNRLQPARSVPPARFVLGICVLRRSRSSCRSRAAAPGNSRSSRRSGRTSTTARSCRIRVTVARARTTARRSSGPSRA